MPAFEGRFVFLPDHYHFRRDNAPSRARHPRHPPVERGQTKHAAIQDIGRPLGNQAQC